MYLSRGSLHWSRWTFDPDIPNLQRRDRKLIFPIFRNIYIHTYIHNSSPIPFATALSTPALSKKASSWDHEEMGLIIVPGQNTKHFLSKGFEWPDVSQSYLPMSSSFEVGSLWSIEEWSSSHWWRTSSEGNTAGPWACALSSEWGYPGSMMPKTLVHLHVTG